MPPTYDYVCSQGHEFAHVASVAEPVLEKCSDRVRRPGGEEVTLGIICDAPVRLQLSPSLTRVAGGTPKFHR